MKADGPPGASANGFNENQALFSGGKCAMWIDATSAAGRVSNPKSSQVADKVGFAVVAHCSDPERLGLGLVLGARHSGLDQEGSRREGLRPLGDLEGLRQARRRRPRAGSQRLPARASRPMTTRVSEGCALRADRAERDHDGRPDPRDQGPGPLHGRAVRRPFPSSRASGRMSARTSPRALGSDRQRDGRTGEVAGVDHQRDEEGRLHQVTPAPGPRIGKTRGPSFQSRP